MVSMALLDVKGIGRKMYRGMDDEFIECPSQKVIPYMVIVRHSKGSEGALA